MVNEKILKLLLQRFDPQRKKRIYMLSLRVIFLDLINNDCANLINHLLDCLDKNKITFLTLMHNVTALNPMITVEKLNYALNSISIQNLIIILSSIYLWPA